MLLAINANNTNVVFAVCDGDRMVGDWRIATDPRPHRRRVCRLAASADGSWPACRSAEIDGAIIATVVPQACFNLHMLCEKHLKAEPLVVGDPDVELGIEVADRHSPAGGRRRPPGQCRGGHVSYKGPLIVVDFGTATTFDVVDADGNYLGGVIAPGINLSLEALHMAAAKLPRIAVERPARVIGKDTVTAMQSGIYWGYVGLIEGMVARIKAEFGAPMEVIATGGLAPLFDGGTPRDRAPRPGSHHCAACRDLSPEPTLR